MSFYTSIHAWYDEIFPFVPAQRDFVLSFGSDPALSIADVGCGSGSLIVSLGKVFRKTAGLDPDESMLELALRKAGAEPVGTWFMQAGMLDLSRELQPASVDRLICFGNTLPHLASHDEVAEMLGQSFSVLRKGGILLLQIINFSRVFRNGLPGLPTLENDRVRFVRNYLYEKSDPEFIRFHTVLTIKSTGEIIENVVPLLAISEERLLNQIREAGFVRVKTYGSFDGAPFTPESQPLIVTAMKD